MHGCSPVSFVSWNNIKDFIKNKIDLSFYMICDTPSVVKQPPGVPNDTHSTQVDSGCGWLANLIHYSKDTFQQRQTSELLMSFEQSLLFQMYKFYYKNI